MVDDAEKAKPVILTPYVPPPQQGETLSTLMKGTAVVAIGCSLVLAWGPQALIAGIILGIVLLIFFGIFSAKVGVSRQETLLLSLAIASERSIPLSAAALAFAEQYGNAYRQRVQMLAMFLDEGVPLPRAMERVRGLVSGESRILAAIGWDAGQLGPALRQAAAMKLLRQSSWGAVLGRVSYLTWMLIWMQVIFSFIMYFIVPKFEAIFSDFGVPLPQITISVIDASHRLVSFAPLTGLLILAEVLIVVLIPLSFVNSYEIDLAVVDSLFRRKHVGLILRSLALTVDGGKPIESGLALLARDYPSSWVQVRLRLILDATRRGESWTSSFQHYGLLSKSEAQTLDAASRVGNLGWVLRELAESSDRRLGYRLQLWSQFLFPVAVLAVGIVVFLVCVAYFAPLVTLIMRLSG